jgi:hypothetical protein
MTQRYEVLRIDASESVLDSFATLDDAFDDCLVKWALRRVGMPAYAVRDRDTEQRWSYADIRDMRRAAERAAV